MEQRGGWIRESPGNWLPVAVAVVLDAVALVAILVHPSYSHNHAWLIVAGTAFGATLLAPATYAVRWVYDRAGANEAQARQRVREAEDELADALRGGPETRIVVHGDATIYQDAIAPGSSDQNSGDEQVQQIPLERRDDGLTLAALWNLTHGKMDLYHTIVTGQARNSFRAAQAAMGIGFVLLVVFAVLAVQAKTAAAAIGAGGLGAVSAALSGYIARTFIRSQESSASHLRAYFDQPLELSRYLAAERLLADAKDLKPDQHAAIISALVQSIATAGQKDGTATKPTGRQPRGRASR